MKYEPALMVNGNLSMVVSSAPEADLEPGCCLMPFVDVYLRTEGLTFLISLATLSGLLNLPRHQVQQL